MAQFDTPLGSWNIGKDGMSEHNPSFDNLMHMVYRLDELWINTSGATMRHLGNGTEITRETLAATLRYIIGMYSEAE